MNYCSPYQLYEYDTVKTLVDEIESTQIGLLEFASQAASIATNKTKDPIKISNILKVVDIERTQVSQKTRDFLKEYYEVYSDRLDTIGRGYGRCEQRKRARRNEQKPGALKSGRK